MIDPPVRALLVVFLLVLAGLAGGGAVGTAARAVPGSQDPWRALQHVVVVVMENRAYDNFFGAYCLSISVHCPDSAAGLPPGICQPYNPSNLSLGCVTPFNLTTTKTRDLVHSWTSSHIAYDNGSMDGFISSETGRNHLSPQPMGHYNGTTLPTYWDMAEEFGLGDNFYSSTLTYSLPNHWYLIAGDSPIHKVLYGGKKQAHDYLNAANNTSTVEQELASNTNVSWSYYDWSLTSYANAINLPELGEVPGSAYSLWNPLAAKHQSYVGANLGHFVSRTQFYADAAHGSLPNISWVIPSPTFSDHAPADLTAGENFVASVVNSVGSSTEWNSTAVFVLWDDYGGWYDHVAPPQLDRYGDGFRAPLLVISPWTASGFVGHDQLQFESILRLVEWHWNLGCLTARDCNAALPTEFFNFSLARGPVSFPNAAKATYPYTAPATGRATQGEALSDFGLEQSLGPNLSDND